MSQQYDNALHMMEAMGGSFVQSLAACYYAADPTNRRRLLDAFPDWFGSYEEKFRQAAIAKGDCGILEGTNRTTSEPHDQRGDWTAMSRAPMLRSTHPEPDMLLPEGKTCADCVHFKRCNLIYGHIAADEVCDWAPSRFQEPRALDATRNQLVRQHAKAQDKRFAAEPEVPTCFGGMGEIVSGGRES